MKYEGFRVRALTRRAMLFGAIFIAALAGRTVGWATPGQEAEHPSAHRVDQFDTYHGVRVHDPYRWLEDPASDDTLAFVEAQDRLTSNTLDSDPRFADYRERFLELQSDPTYFGAQRRGNRVFYFKRTLGSGSRGSVVVVEDGAHRVLIDSEATWPTGTTQVQAYQPDPGGARLLLAISNGPGTPQTWRVLDVASGRLLDDEVVDLLPGAGRAWRPSGDGFYYTAYAVPEGGTIDDIDYTNQRVLLHRIGTSQADDRVVFTMPDEPSWRFGVTVTHDGRTLLISAAEARRNVNHLFAVSIEGEAPRARRLPLPAESSWTYVDNDGDEFVLLAKHQAPKGKLVRIDSSDGDVTELIGQSEHTLRGMQRAGDRWIGTYVVDARRELHVFDREGRHEGKVDLPGLGGLGVAGRPDDPIATATTRHVGDPGTIWEIDTRTREVAHFLRAETSIEADDYVIEQNFVTSADGTRVPVSMVRRRDLKRDGTNPVFMYGYGAWNWAAFPYFQTQWHLWVELGGIFAVPNIRGGGEYGEEWHQAGIKLNKTNAFDDMIAAAEWFAESGWSSPGRIIANGGSASGLLAAAVAMRRPELFGGAVIDHPGLDLLRSQAQPGGQFLVPEYGSVDDVAEFHALHAISPYHNVQDGTCYPPMLVTVGEADRSTAPMHGLKYVAAVQHASDCRNPALLEWVPNGGHLVFGTTDDEQADILARQLIFARRSTERPW